MTTSITVSFTPTQKKEMDYWMTSIQDFLDNFGHETARQAGDEIITKLVAHCNANDIALATGRDAKITQAYDLGVVETRAAREAASSGAADGTE